MLNVKTDSREQKRIDLAKDFFSNNNCEVKVEELSVGDYLFNDTVVFEFKTADDYVNSCMNHSIIPQLINQTEKYPYSFLIIQGDVEKSISQKTIFSTSNIMNIKMMISHIERIINIICPVLRTNKDNAFDLMLKQAKTCLNHKTLLTNTFRMIKVDENPAIKYLTSTRKIGYNTAKLICDYHNITNLKYLLNLNYDDLTKINGIGDKKAKLILKTINE